MSSSICSEMSRNSYALSDREMSQRVAASKSRSEKLKCMAAVNTMLPKFRLHLDETLRLRELAEYICATFTYEQVASLYHEHVDFVVEIAENKKSILALESIIAELQEPKHPLILEPESHKRKNERSEYHKLRKNNEYIPSLADHLAARELSQQQIQNTKKINITG